MRKILLKLALPREERKAINVLVDLYYPKVENPEDETAKEVKRVLEKIKSRF